MNRRICKIIRKKKLTQMFQEDDLMPTTTKIKSFTAKVNGERHLVVSLLTLSAIFILMVQLGPEFFRGNRWCSVMPSASSRWLSGSVNVPREHSCFSSFT